jgi:hypothetical protein
LSHLFHLLSQLAPLLLVVMVLVLLVLLVLRLLLLLLLLLLWREEDCIGAGIGQDRGLPHRRPPIGSQQGKHKNVEQVAPRAGKARAARPHDQAPKKWVYY